MMNTAKTLAKLAVLALALFLIPNAEGQTKQQAQQPPAKAKNAKVAKSREAAPAATAPKPAVKPVAEKSEPIVSRRDPFAPLVSVAQASGGTGHLPPGKAGLVVGTVRVDGTVKSSNGMIAVVSNPQERVYFVREGDRLYDGDVEKISLDGVTFRENSRDAFGKPVERLVTKRIYPSAGEQQ